MQGDANFICGGPPCQGVSGFNRFRNAEAPLEDTKNKQLLVYMDIIDFLKPKYVLMENVVDILKFSGGYLGRYAIGRLVRPHGAGCREGRHRPAFRASRCRRSASGSGSKANHGKHVADPLKNMAVGRLIG